MIDIKTKRMVKTRKEHMCFGCLEGISKGEVAVCINAKEDEQNRRFHLHLECNKMISKDKWFSGSGLYRGCIKNAEKSFVDMKNLELVTDEELPFSMMKSYSGVEV